MTNSALQLSYTAILITSTMLLWNVCNAYVAQSSALDTRDYIFVALFLTPSGLAYLCAMAAFSLSLFKMDRSQLHHIHADVVCCLCLSLVVCDCFGSRNAMHSPFRRCCDSISRTLGLCMTVVNVASIFVLSLVLLLLLPFLVVFLVFNKDGPPKSVGLVLQSAIVALWAMAQLFLLDQYGYRSLVVVLCGVAYATVGFLSLGPKLAMYLLLELLTLLASLTLTFVVSYASSVMYAVSVACFALYVFPNVPISRLLAYKYFKDNIGGHSIFRFLVDSPASFDDATHCVLHAALHDAYDAEAEAAQAIERDETTALLVGPNVGVGVGAGSLRWSRRPHARHSAQCFQMQYAYARGGATDKTKAIRALRASYGATSRCGVFCGKTALCGYALSSLLTFVYPLLWFAYVWIYLDVVEQGRRSLSAKSVFVWFICAAYLVVAVYWMVVGVAGVCSANESIVKSVKAAVFVWAERRRSAWRKVTFEQMLQEQEVVMAVMDAKCLEPDIALLVLLYLL